MCLCLTGTGYEVSPEPSKLQGDGGDDQTPSIVNPLLNVGDSHYSRSLVRLRTSRAPTSEDSAPREPTLHRLLLER